MFLALLRSRESGRALTARRSRTASHLSMEYTRSAPRAWPTSVLTVQ
jgi:hypothetical protein